MTKRYEVIGNTASSGGPDGHNFEIGTIVEQVDGEDFFVGSTPLEINTAVEGFFKGPVKELRGPLEQIVALKDLKEIV